LFVDCKCGGECKGEECGPKEGKRASHGGGTEH
jgi:hypothetical protein